MTASNLKKTQKFQQTEHRAEVKVNIKETVTFGCKA